MRLEVLNTGYGFGTKALFKLIETFSRQPVPDAAKLTFYRSDFYGSPMKQITHEAMRGRSDWSVGERELMAAYVSLLNDSQFCIAAHTATATLALRDEPLVEAVLTDLDSAPIEEPLRATLKMLARLSREHTVSVEDMTTVLDAGATPQQIEDALAVCFAFNVTDRLADAFGFRVLSPEEARNGAKYLLKRGYR
jgi:AhpD family alkylhydroperoxidase